MKGFTLLELLAAVVILTIFAAMAVPTYTALTDRASQTNAIADIGYIQLALAEYYAFELEYPDSLDELPQLVEDDPWGNPYHYQRIEGADVNRGKLRKDKKLVPINTDYDLYSAGPDGETSKPLTAKQSHDDIVRAANGAFIGVAEDY